LTFNDGRSLSRAEIQDIVSALEDGVTVDETAGDPHEHGHSHGHNDNDDTDDIDNYRQIKKLIYRIAAGLIFLTAAIYSQNPSTAFVLYSLSYICGAYPLIISAFKNLFSRNLFDENFLMSVATIGAFALGDYHEAIGVTIFFQIGEVFEHYSIARSRKSIKSLMGLRPDYINLFDGSSFVKTPPESAKAGDTIRVKPGEKVALDCVVTEGEASIDMSALTGESLARRASAGSEIPGGSLNIDGLISARVLRPYAESSVSKILSLIEGAAAKKAKTEKFITKFAKYYTPAVVFAAMALCIVPWLFMGLDFTVWFKRALIFLVISCPCALVISIPLGFFGGIGAASKRGILIKGANHLEALNNLKTVIFDKTGTITRGNFEVIDVVVESGTREEILKYAAIAEAHSSHPIARAIKKAYGAAVDESMIGAYEEIRGLGIKAEINGANVFVGHDRFLHDEEIEHRVCIGAATTVHVAVNKKYSGYIVIADELKPESAGTVEWLKQQGIHTAMLTGDNHITAANVAKLAGIPEFYADLLPHQKVEKLEYYKHKYHGAGHTAFAGDGINDAPVIALADIGFAMGGLGSDAAIESADIVLMNDSPAKIVEAIQIARRTRVIVYQNIALALGVKGVLLVLGAFGMAGMWDAVFADVGVAVLAILNSMRAMSVSRFK
jgi:Cd2+/Zn2+-exporting ATPase